MTQTASVLVEDRQIVLPVTVIPIGGTGAVHRDYKGVVDTGAQGTMISQTVVNDLRLVPASAQDFITADGAVHTRPMCAVGIPLYTRAGWHRPANASGRLPARGPCVHTLSGRAQCSGTGRHAAPRVGPFGGGDPAASVAEAVVAFEACGHIIDGLFEDMQVAVAHAVRAALHAHLVAHAHAS